MAKEYHAIRIEKGENGFGGPLIVMPTAKRSKVMYILGEVETPEPLARIVQLSGMEPVDGYQETVPEDELGLVIVDCGGTLRCGIYPKKRVPTINVMPVGAAGPLAEFIKEDIYASAVTSAQITLASEEDIAAAKAHYAETGDKHLIDGGVAKTEEKEEPEKKKGGLFGIFKK